MKRKDYERLLQFAEVIGITVEIIHEKNPMWGGEWYYDDNTIKVWETSSAKKKKYWIEKIMIMGHELGHAIDDRINGLGNDEAFEYLPDKNGDPPVPKWAQKEILFKERQAAKYRRILFKIIQLDIAEWKLKIEDDEEIWSYEHIFKTGCSPTREECREFRRNWKRKWRKKRKVDALSVKE